MVATPRLSGRKLFRDIALHIQPYDMSVTPVFDKKISKN